MVKESGNENSVAGSEMSHRCGRSCLGPLTFHCQSVGDMVRLSQGCLLAERREDTFRNGLVFSSRPVKVQERIRLRVEKDLFNWHGALRVGFTNVPPSARSLPLPQMAIPNLTDLPGHWAAPLHESYCQSGSELEFWVSCGGTIYVTSNNIRQHKLLTGVDLRQPLWAMIDIYGQTCSIFLLGSEKRGLFCTRRSCPAPERLTLPNVDNHFSLIPDASSLYGNSEERISCLDTEVPGGEGRVMDCVVCMVKEARITLPCDHRCLCNHCASRVFQQFGTCPLCRQEIRAPCVTGTL
ncbi:E3 ubiquitin-protein ligase NEURL3 [Siniperca chuatsi]|uniref:E3 ubiquitin-protein ligase NEURL3 n=1 Tax=Siniperca chuatsi TaxID=119488 RepID=UPI001CE05435|nr:E3 ubiquitin-protein ligase NEURL3 [Siniperca chuatsi]UMW88591.1 neuralized E3 ubiquitin protein ligase 3 [Siniperca chuatsi]